MCLKTAFADYALDELGRAESTVKQYLWRLGYLERTTGKPIEQVSSGDLRALKRSSLSSASVKGIIVAAHQFHRWGALEGHWVLDGICLVRTPKEVNRTSVALSLSEVRTLKATCSTPLEHRLLYLGLYAGMRIGESARFTSSMWQGDFIRFRGEKGGADIETPVHPDLESVRGTILASSVIHPSSLQKVKERLARRAGVDFIAHQLRKSFSSALYDADVPDEVVGDLLGHAGSVTRRYAPVSRRKRVEAIARLSY